MSAASPEPSGILVIDKRGGMTSHDVVSQIRRRFRTRKVGHLGTLDPMATGVLPVTLGKSTRLGRFVATSPKEYTGRIRLGVGTTTCDAEGEPIGEPVLVNVEYSDLSRTMGSFIGTILQTPPEYSAKKIGGTPAHRLARRGVEVRLEPVQVRIDTCELVRFQSPDLDFRIVCSGGTYIRSIARDLGAVLGTGAHLTALRRTQSGPFTLETAIDTDQAGPEHVISPERFLAGQPSIQVDDEAEGAVRHGRPVQLGESSAIDTGDVCIFNKKGELIAIAVANQGWARPKVVLV